MRWELAHISIYFYGCISDGVATEKLRFEVLLLYYTLYMNALYIQNRTLISLLLQNIVTFCDNFFPLQPWLSPRPISKCQLNTLLYLHLIPIYLVVFKGSY